MSRLLKNIVLLISLLLLAGCNSTHATITWETASEVDTAGFNLYRSNTPDGPWLKINQQLIPPSDDPISGGAYKFVDPTAQAGQTYYYQLEEIELGGHATRFDPIILKTSQQISWFWWGLGLLGAVIAGWLLEKIIRGRKTTS